MSQVGHAPGHGPKRRKEFEAGGEGGARKERKSCYKETETTST